MSNISFEKIDKKITPANVVAATSANAKKLTLMKTATLSSVGGYQVETVLVQGV